jgi:hypothetical protein
MDKLTELANKYASDKGTISPDTGHHGPRLHFTPKYNIFFEPLKDQKINILEIGVGSGPSLKMWYEFFPNATIHAIDVENQSSHENDRVKTYICDQSKREELEQVMEKIGPVDIIIDDGSHVVSHQQISIGFLFKYLKNGGQYWIEDLHTSDGSVWQGRILYSYNMSFEEGQSTVNVIEDYLETKKFDSPFLTPEENDYLTQNIEECKLYDLPETFYGKNKLSLFKKKQ